MRLFRWSIPELSTRDRITVALCSMMLSFLVIGIGWVKAKRMVRRKLLETVQTIETKTGWPMDIGSWSLGPGFVTLEDVRIGPESSLLVSQIRVVPSLNPFSKDFGKPALMTVGSVRFKAKKDLFRDLQQRLKESHRDQEGDPQDSHSDTEAQPDSSPLKDETGKEVALEALFRLMPVETFEIKSAGMELIDDEGSTLFAVHGMRLRASRAKRKIILRTESLAYKNYAPEQGVEGRIAISSRGTYRFFLRRRAESSKSPPLWLISGEAEKNLNRIQLFTKTRQLPTFLTNLITPILGPEFVFMTSGRVKAVRESDGWRFALRLKSQNVTFVAPVISKDPIGPVVFELSARGEASTERGDLTLENATLTLPPRQSRAKESQEPLELSLKGASILSLDKKAKTDSSDDKGTSAALQIALTADLPQTPCQVLLDAAPPGLVPKIEDFRMHGDVRGRLNIVFDSKQPEVSEMSPQAFDWRCEVESEPERYAAEKLKQPFMLEKSDDSPKGPVTRVLSPTNPNFRPLREMSPSVPLAFVASEDASFFAHNGIDSSAIEGAFKRNLTEGRIAVGGSTITMQTAKNLFLTNDRTISRKLQELFFAWHMERVLSKDRILEIYLNIVEFGPGIFGIVHAAKHYFNKEPINLTLTESAYLASLLPSPKHRYLSFCRGHLTPGLSSILSGLLRRMLSLGRISMDRFETANTSSLRFNEQARLASAACDNLTPKAQSQN